METRTPELPSLPPPPGAVAALINGFNAVATNVSVILLPVALDLFLWLGPRLKGGALLAPIMEALPDIQAQVPADQARLLVQFMTDFQSGLNLFSILRTFPLGIFSLLSTNFSVTSPLGLRIGLDLPGWLISIVIMMILALFGWLGGSLYFRSVSRAALKLSDGPGILRSMFHGFLLSLTWMLFFLVAELPLGIMAVIMTMLGPVVRTILVILLSIPVVWILLAIYYSFYGIFTSAQNAYTSVINSFRMLRYGMPPLGWFTMMTVLIGQGMDVLWRVAPATSWMMGIGILGHAFVSTSLLAASFIYYRDLNIWIGTALQWIKNQNKSSARV